MSDSTFSQSGRYSRHIGRVGALAVALGVGSGIVAMPIAFADTTGSAGSTSDQSATSSLSPGGAE